MKVNVRGKGANVGVTDSIQTSVEKVAKKLEKYVSEQAELTVAIRVEGNLHTAEFSLSDTGVFTRVEESGMDMYNVIHDAGEMMERKLRRYKEKMTAKYAGRPTSHAVPQRIGDAVGEPEDKGAADEKVEIRRVKRFDIKPMFPEDAILEMEMVGHDFFVFQNAEEHCKVNVIYKRKKGGYGLIQPEYE
ncbi:MAG: ribosome-associated translation inhibitor RaiA [Clostridiales bacterium]|nr:ribosome-associated translation inhibitor RaiA [Clostridiales bacterium]